MSKLVIITGNIGSGKSTAAKIIRDQGYETIDTDQLVHQFYEEEAGITTIRDNFGDQYIKKGKVDRKSLGKLVFSNEKLLEKLENIVHTVIMELLEKEISSRQGEVLFIEIPQYFEMEEKWRVQLAADEVLLIVAEDKLRLHRLMERNAWTEEEASQRMAAQISQDVKKRRATTVIDNSSTFSSLKEAIQKYLKGVK